MHDSLHPQCYPSLVVAGLTSEPGMSKRLVPHQKLQPRRNGQLHHLVHAGLRVHARGIPCAQIAGLELQITNGSERGGRGHGGPPGIGQRNVVGGFIGYRSRGAALRRSRNNCHNQKQNQKQPRQHAGSAALVGTAALGRPARDGLALREAASTCSSIRRTHPPTTTCQAARTESFRPKTSMTVMSIALAHPASSRDRSIFQFPIRKRELVKCSNGNMANGSCSASTT